MSNSILEVKLTQSGAINSGAKVIFNEKTIESPGIEYEDGIITFNETGQYSIKWWVATETTIKGTIGFELQSPQGNLASGCSPIKTGQVSGFGAIDVATVGTTLSLVNMSEDNAIMISRKTLAKGYLLITPIGGAKQPVESYHFNLSRFNSSKDIQVKNVIYRLTRRSSGVLVDLRLGPVGPAVMIDYRRLSFFDDATPQGRRADSLNLGSFISIDDGLYIDSNEINTVWLRQKDLTEDKYSTCIIRYLPGGPNASRVEVWVEWISEDVTYGDPL